ncbi:MAG: GMP/IMP nucleotidase [Gammaproteobacteria bacterium]|nr:GMP/IMP nucleotidase [Gammaproteobacteria bacterium]
MVKVDWSSIKTVFLDLDGTLLDLHFDNHFWLEYVPIHYADKHSISVDTAKQQLGELYGEFGGTLNWYCVDFWTKRIGLDIRSLKEDVSHKIAIRPYVEEFLQFLLNQGKRIVLVTNAHEASIAIKMEKTKLHKYFHRIISSHQLKLAKEETGFWEKLNKEEPFEKASTLFIDDNLTVLKAADDYGIEHLRAIHLPDSQGAVIKTEDYAVIENYREIM